jgi:exodeoxyribonuclease VII small subunit
MAKKISYGEAIAEIEEIIRKIEQEELDVDELSDKVKRVSFLINYCREKLRNTEEEVSNILKEIGKNKLTEGPEPLPAFFIRVKMHVVEIILQMLHIVSNSCTYISGFKEKPHHVFNLILVCRKYLDGVNS